MFTWIIFGSYYYLDYSCIWKTCRSSIPSLYHGIAIYVKYLLSRGKLVFCSLNFYPIQLFSTNDIRLQSNIHCNSVCWDFDIVTRTRMNEDMAISELVFNLQQRCNKRQTRQILHSERIKKNHIFLYVKMIPNAYDGFAQY